MEPTDNNHYAYPSDPAFGMPTGYANMQQSQSSDEVSLFTSSEQTGLFGFLNDNFGWEVDPALQTGGDDPSMQGGSMPPPPPPGESWVHDLPPTGMHFSPDGKPFPRRRSTMPTPASAGAKPAHLPSITEIATLQPQSTIPQPRPLLTTPQKRLNHILSEQKRRNQIRDSYATLAYLLEGPVSGPGCNPALKGSSGVTRDNGGVIKGRKGRARGGGKKAGKAGTLFRAVEYVNFLTAGLKGIGEDIEEKRAKLGMTGNEGSTQYAKPYEVGVPQS